MTAEGIAAIIMGGIAFGGVIYAMGASNYRFTEAGDQSKERDRELENKMIAMEQRLRNEINGIGTRMRTVEGNSARQFNNINNAVIAMARAEDKHFVAGYLREEKTN